MKFRQLGNLIFYCCLWNWMDDELLLRKKVHKVRYLLDCAPQARKFLAENTIVDPLVVL